MDCTAAIISIILLLLQYSLLYCFLSAREKCVINSKLFLPSPYYNFNLASRLKIAELSYRYANDAVEI